MDGSTIVLAAVVERDGSYLICRRPVHKRYGGLWEFPGGKLEAGESLNGAAKRELWEELRLEVTDVGAILAVIDDEGSNLRIHFVEVRVSRVGVPTLLEHDALAWVPKGEMHGYPLVLAKT